jgi:uroporphyrinogen-III synthase
VVATADASPSFHGLRVLSFESRRAAEIASLISTFGGQPLVVPALREVPLESNLEALDFADALVRGELDIVIFLTGVGTRALAAVAEARYPREVVAAALGRTRVVVRGPKPLAAVRELQVPVWVTVPEPNTWRELLAALDAKAAERPLAGARIAVQEYGISNPELIDALVSRGAIVTRVPVYRWALPENVEPLKSAVRSIARGDVDVVMFTTGVQVVHLWQIAGELQIEAQMRGELGRTMVASIGPSTSEELGRHGLAADFEPSHPKIGILVREAAERSTAVLHEKRGR